MVKKIKLLTKKVFAEEKSKPRKVNKEYVKVIPNIELKISEGAKLVFSVTQTGQNKPAHVDIRTFVKTDKYKGPTKRGINFDIENLYEITSILQKIDAECKKLNI